MALAVHGRVDPEKALQELQTINADAIDIIDRAMRDMDPMGEVDVDSEEEIAIHEYQDGVEEHTRRVLSSGQDEEPGLELYDSLRSYENHISNTISDWAARGWISDEELICNTPIGFTEGAAKFSRVNPESIGLLRLAARVGAPVSVVPLECELRFRPEDLMIAGVWREPIQTGIGSAAKMTMEDRFNNEIKLFYKSSLERPFQPTVSRGSDWLIHGDKLAQILAATENSDTFIRFLNFAMDHSVRIAIQRSQIPFLTLPNSRSARYKGLNALYHKLRSYPIRFTWSEPMYHESGVIMSSTVDGKTEHKLGYIWVGKHDKEDVNWCEEDAKEITVDGVRASTLAPYAPTFEVTSSQIEVLLRNAGYGKKLYISLIIGLLKRNPDGFYLIPNSCGNGATSFQASRVWDSLRRELPSHGEVVFVPPGWKPKTMDVVLLERP